MEVVPRSYESDDPVPQRRVALLLVHGMGEQQPHELTDVFAVRLAREYRELGHQVGLRHRVVAAEDHRASQSYVELQISKPEGGALPATVIDLHEVYWADRPQGLIKIKEVGRWLFATSLAPLFRWSHHAASYYRRPRTATAEMAADARPPAYEYSDRVGALGFAREVLLALTLPVLGALLFMLAVGAVFKVDDYLAGVSDYLELHPTPWTGFALLAVFAVLASAGLFLLLGGWGVSRQEGVEREFLRATATERNEDRWRYLTKWAVGSWVTGVVLLGGAAATYRDPDVQGLVAAFLRLGDAPAWQLPAAAIALLVGIVLWWRLLEMAWRIPWSLAPLRVIAVVAVVGGAAFGAWFGYQALPEEWEHPVRLVFWLAALAGTWKLSAFLIGWIGDVAIYFGGLDARSRHNRVREEILHLVTSKLVSLALLSQDPRKSRRRKGAGTPYYDEVLVAAHSLGSVIAYDAINRLAVEQRSDSDGDRFRLERDAFDRIKGLFTFGSPLDKVIYFFQQTGKVRQPVRAQIISSLISMRRHSTGRPYGEFKFDDYDAIQPEGFRWHNAWSWGDVLGHRLDHFQIDRGKQFHFDYVPLIAHTLFWQDPLFYRRVVEWVDAESS